MSYSAFAAGDGGDSAPAEASPVSPVDTPPPQEDEDHDDEDHEGEEAGVLDFHAHDVVVVTGSAIEEPAVDLPYAVEVLNREILKEQGSLQTVDLIKNLTASSAVIGEANSWYNDQGTAVPESVANVNLRGLGASRTLVLLNGRRQAPLPARLFGGRFVDINAFPSIAVDRIEVLKEGAAAIYGSDAVAGVANFVTRDEFTGFEVSLSHEGMDGAGDSTAGAIWGGKLGGSDHHLVFSLERAERSHLGARERPFTLKARDTGWFWGWSNTGNPGIFLRPNLTGGETSSAFVQELARARNGSAGTDYFVDPACNGLGGYDRGFTCAFRYQPWDSLIEATETNRFFAELNGPLAEGTSYHVEALFAESTIPNYVTTPSFPPVSLLDGLQVVPSIHPRAAGAVRFGLRFRRLRLGAGVPRGRLVLLWPHGRERGPWTRSAAGHGHDPPRGEYRPRPLHRRQGGQPGHGRQLLAGLRQHEPAGRIRLSQVPRLPRLRRPGLRRRRGGRRHEPLGDAARRHRFGPARRR